MATPFLDTNILLRHLLQEYPEQSLKCTAYLARIERGEVKARISDTVIFETVFVLERHYRIPKAAIRENVLALLQLPGIVLPGKRRFHRVFDLYVDLNLSFADAYHAVLMRQLGLADIVSFDKQFDRVPGISRIEPIGG